MWSQYFPRVSVPPAAWPDNPICARKSQPQLVRNHRISEHWATDLWHPPDVRGKERHPLTVGHPIPETPEPKKVNQQIVVDDSPVAETGNEAAEGLKRNRDPATYVPSGFTPTDPKNPKVSAPDDATDGPTLRINDATDGRMLFLENTQKEHGQRIDALELRQPRGGGGVWLASWPARANPPGSHLASHPANHHCFVHARLPRRPCSQDLKMMSPIHGVCGKLYFPLSKAHHASGWGFGLFARVGIQTSWSSCTMTNTIAVALCCSASFKVTMF